MESLSSLFNLRDLKLSSCSLNNDHVTILTKLTNLGKLDISKNSVSDDGLISIFKLTNLLILI